jgi:O-antigen/teichoic acid export membrane protein
MKQRLSKILRWSEKYTKTDMVYAVKNLSFLTGGQFLGSLVTLLFAIFIAHIFSKESYGNYKYILSTVALINSFALTGLGPALVRAVSKGYDGTLKQFSKLNFFWAFIPASILTVLSIYYYTKGNTTLSIGILIGGLTLPLIEKSGLYASVLNGKKLFRQLSWYTFLRNTIPTIAVALTAYLSHNPLYMAAAYFITTSIVLNILCYNTVYVHIENSKVDPDALSVGKHTSFINAFSLITDQIDNVLIFQTLGGAALAVYNFAEAIPNTIQGFIKQFGVLAMPKFAAQSVSSIQKNIVRKSIVLFLCTIPIVVVYWFAAPYIYKILFPGYVDSVFYSQLLALALVINASIPIAFFDSQKAIREKYYLSLFSNSFKLVAIIVLALKYGLIGLVIAKLLSKCFGGVVVMTLALRYKG